MPAVEACLTADDLKDDAWATGARRQDNCSQMETKVSGGRVTTHAVCASEGITTTMDMTTITCTPRPATTRTTTPTTMT